MNLRAPVIILPENKPNPALFMVADLGFLTVKSEPVRPEAKKELMAKQGQVLKEEEFSKLVSMMYDKFLISGKKVQVSIGRSLEECRDAVTVRAFISFVGMPKMFSTTIFCLAGQQVIPSLANLAPHRGHRFGVFSEICRRYRPSRAENCSRFPSTSG